MIEVDRKTLFCCCWTLTMTNVVPLQRVPEGHPSDEAAGEHQPLPLHLSHHVHAAGPQHHSRLQHQRRPHPSVRKHSHADVKAREQEFGFGNRKQENEAIKLVTSDL